MKISRFSHARPVKGFSLVELMVGMAIALIGVLLMFQALENYENRKRTASAGGDAQVAGAIALYSLERDIRVAGYGFTGAFPDSMGCTVSAYDTARAAAFTFPMIPVQIVDGAAGAPDQVIVLYGGSALAPLALEFQASSATTKKMVANSSRGGLQKGDLAFAVSDNNCGLIEITDNTNPDQLTIAHETGNYTSYFNVTGPARFNAAAGYSPGSSGHIFNLGPRDEVRRNIWQVTLASPRALIVTDDLHNGTAAQIGENIINLQAEYGIDRSGVRDNVVDAPWQATAPGDWTRVIAIRVALLARSQQYEKTDVTVTPPRWAGGQFVMTDLDSVDTDSAPDGPNNWRRYRYRVYEVTVPLRNMIWAGRDEP